MKRPVFDLPGFIVAATFLVLALAGPGADPAAAEEVLASGRFHGASRHQAAGVARLVKTSDGGYAVSFSEFASDPGPDIFIILSTAEDPRSSGDIKKSRYIALGRRQGETGVQSYKLPLTVDPGKFRSVGIWCRQYSILFGAAPLEREK